MAILSMYHQINRRYLTNDDIYLSTCPFIDPSYAANRTSVSGRSELTLLLHTSRNNLIMPIDITTYRVSVGFFSPYQLRVCGCKPFNNFDLVVWFSILLLLAGDVHENPGPSENQNLPKPQTFQILSSFKAHLSIVHYNIQSILNKSDILYAELNHFDVLAFTETWLDQSTSNTDLYFENYHNPFRQDRGTDRYGGILVYVRISCLCVVVAISKFQE